MGRHALRDPRKARLGMLRSLKRLRPQLQTAVVNQRGEATEGTLKVGRMGRSLQWGEASNVAMPTTQRAFALALAFPFFLGVGVAPSDWAS